MVPKFHAKGTSFKGIAQYVLHDKESDTSERVGWTETVNLATRNPDVAWKVQAATSMDADRLKKEAGVKNTGRKTKAHVQHVTLSWHADEAKGLGKDDQMKAVKWFLREIKADDRQVLVVNHNDQPNSPHVHLVINRVSPQDGRILSSSFEKMKASRWAEKYEKDRGKIYCDQRVINNAARKRGEFTRGEKDTPRHVYEAQAKVANDNDKKKALLAEHRKKAHAIAKKDRETKARHKAEWNALQDRRKKDIQDRMQRMKANSHKAAQKIRDSFKPRWGELHHSLQAERAVFKKNEQTLRGRMQNALKLVEWRQLIGTKPGEKTSLSDAFKVFSNEGSREQALQRQFKAREAALKKDQDTKAKEAFKATQAKEKSKLEASRKTFLIARLDLIRTHQLERAKTRTEWYHHDKTQRHKWAALAKRSPNTSPIELRTGTVRSDQSDGGQVKSSDLLPKSGAKQAANLINDRTHQILEAARRAAANQNDKSRDSEDRER